MVKILFGHRGSPSRASTQPACCGPRQGTQFSTHRAALANSASPQVASGSLPCLREAAYQSLSPTPVATYSLPPSIDARLPRHSLSAGLRSTARASHSMGHRLKGNQSVERIASRVSVAFVAFRFRFTLPLMQGNDVPPVPPTINNHPSPQRQSRMYHAPSSPVALL
jgi:hypothetical protein